LRSIYNSLSLKLEINGYYGQLIGPKWRLIMNKLKNILLTGLIFIASGITTQTNGCGGGGFLSWLESDVTSQMSTPELSDFLDQMKNDMEISQKNTSTLHIATNFGFVSLARLILSRGADVNSVDENGDTALHYAVKHEFYQMILQSGMFEKNNYFRQAEMIKLLISRGADVNQPNKQGLTPLDLAKKLEPIDTFEGVGPQGPKNEAYKTGFAVYERFYRGFYKETIVSLLEAAEYNHIQILK